MPALHASLSSLLIRLWPERRHQERLLDLGERNAWTEAERATVVRRLADWLAEELLLQPVADQPPALALGGLPSLPTLRPDLPAVPGVGRRTVALARLVGTAPKTLANSLSDGLRSDRRDHRWLLFLARLERGEVEVDGLVYHRRTPDAVSAALAAGAARATPDLGDALLVLSLVALWQRRRPTEEARASRGVKVPRRRVAKPAAAMRWDLMVLAQLWPLVELALSWGGAPGGNLVAVVIEAALTEAHLAPHRARSIGDTEPAWGEYWLRSAERVVSDPRVVELLGASDAAVFGWRLCRMRAYATGRPLEVQAPTHPYVALATAIDNARAGSANPRPFTSRHAGYLMLLPQARRLGLLDGG